jgi:rRNA maturation endonuclease Nob1
MADNIEKRAQQAQKIKNNPQGYKVCEGCDSIVARKAAVCPSCHSYRFDSSRRHVMEQAEILGNREQTSVTSTDML